MTEPKLWTTSEVVTFLGASSTGSARKILSRLGISAVGREPGRAGENLYDAAEIRAAREAVPSGKHRETREKEQRNATVI